MTHQVDILMATYQGESYIEAQVQSILNQTHADFHLWIRDDQSADRTSQLIDSFQKTHPDKISIIPSRQRLGIRGNFSELMKHAKAPYVMFCDQDDVWLPNKIELKLNKMDELEKKHGVDCPLLVHTDLKVVNQQLEILSPSFWTYSNLDPSRMELNHLLMQNNVTGCTLMMNQKLLQWAYPVPTECVMHDWWLALVATLFGKIGYLKTPTMLYRQHGKNDVGAKKFSLWKKIKKFLVRDFASLKRYRQAQLLTERYNQSLNDSQKEVLNAFCSLEHLSYPRQIKRMWDYQFFPNLPSYLKFKA